MNQAEVIFDNNLAGQPDLVLKPGVNLRTGENNLRASFGQLTTLEKDLLIIASSIFACDLAFKRGERENIIRNISLTIPVVNYGLLQNVRDDIRYALYILSHDAWNLNFIPLQGAPEANQTWVQNSDSKILLFSGGLDSFAAAVNLGYLKEKVHLISHVTGNQKISSSQQFLFEEIRKRFNGQFVRTRVRVGGTNNSASGYSFPTDQNREDSQRTRSFLFLTLAGIAARKLGIKDVIMIAENGQLAIHLPLTAARISAFSTHTAHPEFTEVMNQIINKVLSINIKIQNPFLYMTKAEVVNIIHHSERELIPNTISCWMSARMAEGFSHCGECVPCLIRRIANEYNNVSITEYKRDVLSEDIAKLNPDDKGKRNFVELAEFIRVFSSIESQAQIIRIYPELTNGHFDTQKAINMYKRFAIEAGTVLKKYPNIASLVS